VRVVKQRGWVPSGLHYGSRVPYVCDGAAMKTCFLVPLVLIFFVPVYGQEKTETVFGKTKPQDGCVLVSPPTRNDPGIGMYGIWKCVLDRQATVSVKRLRQRRGLTANDKAQVREHHPRNVFVRALHWLVRR
jgi:hypothetical protein